MTDLERLSQSLRSDFPSVKQSTDLAWSRSSAVRVIDCVLSLNRNYDHFVVPRLNRFELRFPETTTVEALRGQIDGFDDAEHFMRETLDYRDANRARILDAVVSRLLVHSRASTGANELSRIERWATEASPRDYEIDRIRGFALAGHQYLRMLFGANTTKPDVHILRYVHKSIGRSAPPLEALTLLEEACATTGTRIRDLDTTIWESSARGCINHQRLTKR